MDLKVLEQTILDRKAQIELVIKEFLKALFSDNAIQVKEKFHEAGQIDHLTHLSLAAV